MEETFTYDNINRLTGITLTRPSGWLPGDGGNGDHPPGVPYLLNGVITIDLPEVDIVSNAYNEFEYTPYYYGGGGANVPWNNGGNGQQIGPGTGGSGGGSGSHGTGNTTHIVQQMDPSVAPLNNSPSGINLKSINVTNNYVNSANTIIGKGAELGKTVGLSYKEAEAALVLGKISKVSKTAGIIGISVNIGCTAWQMYYDYVPIHEGIVRMGMTGVEFGLAFVPYVGPILSIGLTACDVGGCFDNNLYNTDKWWKENRP